ncbi:hypothetical protein [Zavarzinella formosa]|uniref:hypothetical protein n=1 Tax=Zavarzinella formosa TaxID=360055 RepID=UPI0002F54D68|nr:hypothetical protein [Zavarzinella formosa]
MRRLLSVSLLLFISPVVFAADVDDFVKDVLKAHAKDTATLKKQSISIIKASGTMTLNGVKTPNIRTIQAIWPSQSLTYYEFGDEKMKGAMTLCVVNDRGWKRQSGMSADLNLEEVNDCRQGMYAYWMLTLLPLLESGNKITFTPGIKVNGEPTTSITVARRNWPDMTLSFDPNTLLLRKISYKARETGVTKLQEMILGDHKEVEGIKLPQSLALTLDGKEIFSWTKFEYVFPEKLDRAIFDKP